MSKKPSKTQPVATITREEWLTRMMQLIATNVFESAREGSTQAIGAWRVSCGWPGGGSARKRIGECWSSTTSKRGMVEMFISPSLDDGVRVADVLAHEMVHASVGTECGHRGEFRKLATAIGLEGKMTATVAGAALKAQLEGLVAELGEYPHGALSLKDRKKQTTRMLKLACQDCGYTIRTTAKWIECGVPTCHCGGDFILD